MVHPSKNRWVGYAVLGLSVFLVFCLVFEPYIQVPAWIGWMGRWHPLLLHFPIVLLLICIFLGLARKPIPANLFTVTVLFTLITAISGFFLGKETLVKGDLLVRHQWLGGGLALATALWYGLYDQLAKRVFLARAFQGVLVVWVILAGHYGGMVTHGEDFLTFPMDSADGKIPENPLLYQHVVGRIFKANCVSCHNPNKQKGELLMTGLPEMLKGGKNGSTLVPGDPGKSEILKRLHLPRTDEGHMPPEGKKPLTDTEIAIIERWVALGASDTLRLEHLRATEPLAAMVRSLMEPDLSEKWAKLPAVADSTLKNLASDYLTIVRVAHNANALAISAYLPPEYDPKHLTALKRVAPNIAVLDLSGLPIGQDEMALVAQCKNLERLEIDRTPVTDADIENLSHLSDLRVLKAYQTNLTDKSVPLFAKWENLKSLYLWETKVSEKALEALRKTRPNLLIDYGIEEELKQFFIQKDTVSTEKS